MVWCRVDPNRSWKNRWWFAQRAKPSSGISTKTGFRAIATLPILINQWGKRRALELRTRLFCAPREFLWQEGHTAHATEEEALIETRKMLDVYADFAENVMAVPVVKGRKDTGERFAGALIRCASKR